MTIRPGQEWGTPGPLAPDAPTFASDDTARAHLQRILDRIGPELGDAADFGEIGLVGGDLHRTLGAPRHDEAALRDGAGIRFPVDLGVVRVDGVEHVFLAHLVCHPRRVLRWWSSRTISVMNAAHHGEMDLGPRGHPNDGRLDLTDGVLPLGERRAGRRRARRGDHVPHPGLTTRSVRSLRLSAGGSTPLHVWVDGHHLGTARDLEVRCLPDALIVVA